MGFVIACALSANQLEIAVEDLIFQNEDIDSFIIY